MPPSPKLLLRLCLLVFVLASAAALPIHAETFHNPQRIPLPVDPYGVTTGDLNGDGRPDIIWTEFSGYPGIPLLHVLLAAGNGQYVAAPVVSLPLSPTFVQCVVEDVTGDKRNDLVCVAPANGSTNVYLYTYPGNGDGTFGAPVQTQISSTFTTPILAQAGDLNGDGFADVIMLNGFQSGILPYLSDGQGGFKPSTLFQGSLNFSTPTVTDLNGDGKLDVLWPTGPRVNLGNGDGTFSAPVPYDPGANSNCAFGDVDHDGHLDAACVWFDSADTKGYVYLSVLHGNADGSFSAAPMFNRTFGTGTYPFDGVSTVLTPVLIADLNGDGYADIVSLSGDGYCVLLGGPGNTWNGPPQEFVAASFTSQFGIYGIYGVSIADMNGDGLPDIVAIGPNGLYISNGQKDGTLGSAPAIEVGQVSTSAAVADFNGDGNLDVVSAGDTALKLSLGRGDGTFNSAQPITTSGNFGDANSVTPGVISGDFNGDGKQDLIATGSIAAYTSQTYILFGNGDGTFDGPNPTSLPSPGKVADLNNDGRSDVISIQNSGMASNSLVTSLSRGDGTFTSVTTGLPVETTSTGAVATLVGPALGDLRHSGHLDAAVASSDNVYLLRSNGDGSFAAASTPLVIPNLAGLNRTAVYDITTGDFDGDSNLDLAVLVAYGNGPLNQNTPTSTVWIFYGKGDGTFSPALLGATFDRGAQTVSASDLNGDGLDDLVLTSYNGYQVNGVLIVHALPNRIWGSETDFTGGEGLSRLWITDINHDGHNDLIFSNAGRLNYTADSVSVLLNQPDDTLTGNLIATPEPSYVTLPFVVQATFIPLNPTDTLTGSVVFSVDRIVVGTAGLANNSASLNIPGVDITVGGHTLSATWSGDSTHTAITLSGTHTVDLMPLNISLAAVPNTVVSGNPVVATATFTPAAVPAVSGYQYTGTMTLSDNGVAIAQQPVSSGFSFTLPSLAVGPHILSVAYPGDSLFAAAQSNSVTVTVTPPPAATTLSLKVSPNPAYTGITVTFTASATSAGSALPTGNITFSEGTTVLGVGALSSTGQAVFSTSALAAGTHTVIATYAGNAAFTAATSLSVNEVILASTFSIAVAPESLSIKAGNNGSAVVQLGSLGTFSGPLQLTLGTAPTYATMSLSASSVTLTAGGSGSSTLALQTLGVLALERHDDPRSQGRMFPASLAGLLICCLLPAGKGASRRRLRGLLLMILAAVALSSSTGCINDFYLRNTVAPGVYSLPVTATDTTGRSQTATLALTITP